MYTLITSDGYYCPFCCEFEQFTKWISKHPPIGGINTYNALIISLCRVFPLEILYLIAQFAQQEQIFFVGSFRFSLSEWKYFIPELQRYKLTNRYKRSRTTYHETQMVSPLYSAAKIRNHEKTNNHRGNIKQFTLQ